MKTGSTFLSLPLVKSTILKAFFISWLLLPIKWVNAQECTIEGLPVVCENTTVAYTNTFQGTGLEYSWSLPTGGAIIPNTGNSIFVSWNFAGMHTLRCRVLENSELIATCELTVNVKEQPSGNLAFMPPGWTIPTDMHVLNYCVGDNTIGTLNLRAPDPEATFVWEFIGVSVEGQSAGNISNITFIEEGNLQVCVDVSLANCLSTFCQNIRVYPIPDPVNFEIIESNGGVVCGNQDIYFRNISVGDVPDDAWIWNVDNGTNTWTFRSRDLSFPFEEAGSYDISLQYMPYDNCSTEPVTQSIVIEDLLPLVVGCPTTICFGETATYELLTECEDVTWEVSAEGTIIAQSGNEIEIAWENETGNAFGFITVLGIDCGSEYCTSPTVLTVPLFPPNMTEIDGPDMLCDDHTYTVNGPPGADYLWTATVINTVGGSINLGNSTSSAFTVNVGDFIGTIQLSVEVSHPSLECSSSDEIEIDVYAVSIESADGVCYGSSFDVAIIPPMPGMDIDWTLFYNNQFIYDVTDDDTYTIPAEELIIPGEYTIHAELNNPPNQPCLLAKTFTVAAPITPIGEIYGATEICPGVEVLYSVNAAEGNVFWTIQGGVFVHPLAPNTPTLAVGPIQLVIWDNTTSPKFISAYRDFEQCVSETVTLTVEEYELNDIMIMGSNTACSDGTSQYTASFDGSANFLWSVFPAHIGSILPAEPEDPPSLVRIRWHFTETEIPVFVLVTVADCFASDMNAQFELTLLPFEFTIVDDNGIACAGEPLIFEANATMATSWKWTIDGEDVNNNTGAVLGYTFDHPGQYLVEVVAENPDGCGGAYTAVHVVNIQGLETPGLTVMPGLMCPNPVFPMEITSSIGTAGNYTYAWSRDGNLIPGENESTLIITDLGVYTVTISDGICSREGEITLACGEPMPCDCPPLLEVTLNEVEIGECGAYALSGTITGDAAEAFWTLPGNVEEPVTNNPPTLGNLSVTHPGHYTVMLTGVYACQPVGECPVVATEEFEIPFITDIAYDIMCGNEDGSEYNIHIEDNSSILQSAQITSRQWTVNSQPVGNGLFIDLVEDAATIHEVCLELIEASGYTCERCIEIAVPEQPVLSFSTGFEGGCADNSIDFTPTINVPAGALIEWTWDFGDGSESKLYNPIKVYSEDGNYVITFEAITVYGCTTDVSAPMTVVNNSLDGLISKDVQDCNASVILGFDQLGGGAIIQYEWLPNGETTPTIEVMTNGVYMVLITDEYNCTYSTSTAVVEITEPFNMGVIPTSVDRCMGQGYSLSNYVNNPFGGSWYMIPDPLNYGVDAGNVSISGNLPVGVYTIFLQAIDKMTLDVCVTTSFTLHMHPIPIIDLDHIVVNCVPFLSEVFETSDQIVEWITPSLPPASSIMVTSRGTYTARIINEYGCSKSASETVNDDININFFDVGCRKECIEDIIAGNVVVNGPVGSTEFEYWEWRVNGQVVSSGSGEVPDLTLTEQMIGNITLYLENGGCGRETGNHFVETMSCSPCPPDLSVETVLYEMMPILGDEGCDTYIYYIRGKYLLPAGFVFCDFYPEFEDGYVIYDEFTYTYQPPMINSVEFEAHVYITDFAAYEANDGLLGTIRLCDVDSEDICTADVEIRYQMPMMGMMCNFEHCITMNCDDCGGFTIDQPVGVRSCMTLHFPDCGECGITEYTVQILRYEDVIYTEEVEWDGIDISQEYCLEYTYRYIPGMCYTIRIESDCGHYCNTSVCLNSLEECIEYRNPAMIQTDHVDEEEGLPYAFPNPSNGEILFVNTGNASNSLLSMNAIDGSVIFIDMEASKTATVNTKTLRPGTYIISVQDMVSGKKTFIRYVHLDK